MAESPINLNKARKAKAKADAKARADENAVRFGRTKAQKTLEKTKAKHAEDVMDRHKTD